MKVEALISPWFTVRFLDVSWKIRFDSHYKNRYSCTRDTQMQSKLRHWLEHHKAGTVCAASWFERIGISRSLQQRYKKSGWICPIGTGAYIRPHESVDWKGGVYTIQKQLGLPIHVGGPSALFLWGHQSPILQRQQKLFLFMPQRVSVPRWFMDWKMTTRLVPIRTNFIPSDLALETYDLQSYQITLSSPERAILECMQLAPDQLDLSLCYDLMAGLTDLRPQVVQTLLRQCGSIKAKRLFLYMAERAGHGWLKRVNKRWIDLGKGDRSILPGGVYVSKYRLSLPKELVDGWRS